MQTEVTDQSTEQQAQEPQEQQEQQVQQEGEAAKAEGQDEAKPRDEKGRFKSGLQDRINEITRARHEAEREAAFWRQQALNGTQQPKEESARPAKPTVDQFQDYAEFVEALADWKAEEKAQKVLADLDLKQKQQAEQTEQVKREATWAERQDKAREQIADYDDVMSTTQVGISKAVQDALIESEVGPQLAYHLATHPDEAKRLNGLSPMSAAREIGKLEASISLKAAPKQQPAMSKAPAPISPVSTGKPATTNLANLPMDQYIKARREQGASWAG